MKNAWKVAILLTATLSLAACGGNEAPAPQPIPQPQPQPDPQPNPNPNPQPDPNPNPNPQPDPNPNPQPDPNPNPNPNPNPQPQPLPGDTTAPSVVSITPAGGATGVAKNANIVVTFSEKMNQAATQAAYQSTDLPAAGVTFSWNPAGTVLTINPNADLAYTASGKNYAFTLTNTATDIAGNALPLKTSSFRTYRQITATISSTATLDGRVRTDGNVNTADSAMYVGDSTDVPNAAYRSFLSFDLSGLPAALTSSNVLSAVMYARQTLVLGTPYSSLNVGSSYLLVDHVNYGTVLSGTDFDAPVIAALGNFITSPTLTTYSKSMLSAVQADLSANRTRSQYRLRFAKQTDGDGASDLVHIDTGNSATNKPTLVVTYLIP